jgi:hypothetical protein
MARLALALVGLAVFTAGGCSSAASNPAHRGAQSIAVQNTEVAGLVRCTQSGMPPDVIKAMQSNDPEDARQLQASWDIATTNGALGGYYVAYAASVTECNEYLFGSQPIDKLHDEWLANYVVVFSTDKQARAAWVSGLLFPSPDELHAMGATVGSNTGLGENAVVGTTDNPWLAIWSKGSSWSWLFTNLGPAKGLTVAKTVSARM